MMNWHDWPESKGMWPMQQKQCVEFYQVSFAINSLTSQRTNWWMEQERLLDENSNFYFKRKNTDTGIVLQIFQQVQSDARKVWKQVRLSVCVYISGTAPNRLWSKGQRSIGSAAYQVRQNGERHQNAVKGLHSWHGHERACTDGMILISRVNTKGRKTPRFRIDYQTLDAVTIQD